LFEFDKSSTLDADMTNRTFLLSLCALLACPLFIANAQEDSEDDAVRVGTFDVDASPPIGSPLAYDPTKGIQTPLSCRGIVIAPAGQKPITLCAIDWIGISNGGQTVFKQAIAAAIATTPDRVVVHTLHQHDAPRCDFDAEELIAKAGASGSGSGFDPAFAREVANNAGAAAKRHSPIHSR